MSEQALVEALRNLPAVGQLVKDRGYRQVWRFEFGGRAYYLKWYPREGSKLKRGITGNPAMMEFTRLITLQKAHIPSPRAIAVLRGFKINEHLGDAVILEAIEPSIQLDRFLLDCDDAGGEVPNRYALSRQLIDLIYSLGKAKLGHDDLHLGNIILSDGKLFLLDGYAVRNGGLTTRQLMMLGHSAAPWATRAEMLRGWRLLTATESVPPAENPLTARLCRKFVRRSLQENSYFGRLEIGGYRGVFVKGLKQPRWWASASSSHITREDWQREWPKMLKKIEEDSYEVLKRGDSGNVLAGTANVGGRELEIVIKLPRHKTVWKRVMSVGRQSRNRRTWIKAWKLIVREFPAEWPLLLMEKRVAGYVTDSVLVFARVKGPTLFEMNLDELSAVDREKLFRRLGRTLRRLELAGFGHFDAKSTNWIIMPDARRGPVPVLIDVDGVRHYRWDGTGLRRLLRAMMQHPQYTPQDSLWLCRGYAPRAHEAEETNDFP